MDDNLLETAQKLGETLHQSQAVHTYLQAASTVEDELELARCEAHLSALYQDLAARQRAGEELTQKEVQDFYALRDEVQQHPLIRARNDTLGAVKSLFVETGTHITNQLNVDFTTLALSSLPDA